MQVSEFIKTYYLYNTDNKVDEIFNSNSMSNEDIANALENIKISDDIFTFAYMMMFSTIIMKSVC